MKTSPAIDAMPPAVRTLLASLGSDFRKARKRRKLSLGDMAARCLTTPPTLRKVEAGDPTVSFGVVVTALWALGLENRLASLLSADTFEGIQPESSGFRAENL